MKTRITIIALCAIVAINYHGRAQELNVGLKLGADIANLSGASLNNEFKGYFMGGAFGNVRFEKIGVQAEILLTRTTVSTGDNFFRAFRDYVDSSVSGGNKDIVLTELAFPVMIDYKIIGPLRAELGAQYSLVVNIKDKDDYLVDADDVFEKGYLSGLVGAKADIGRRFHVGVRYLKGFRNLNKTPVDERWETGRFQVYAAFNLLGL